MKFLVLSDIHGDLKYLEKLDEEFAVADVVLFAGDFSALGKPETAKPVLDLLVKKHESIFAVLGNCDEPDFITELEKKDISVEGGVVFREGLAFAGAGGGLKFTGDTPFERTDDEIMHDLRIITEQDTWNNLIAIVHQPPKDTKCDLITAGAHVGSEKLREFIEKYSPLAVITGHIHESFAIDYINNTICINPGPLLQGKYATFEVSKKDGKWAVAKTELKQL